MSDGQSPAGASAGGGPLGNGALGDGAFGYGSPGSGSAGSADPAGATASGPAGATASGSGFGAGSGSGATAAEGVATENEAAGGSPDRATGPELRRDDQRQALAGVCAGLGAYTRVDPVVWRAAFVLTAFAGGAGLLLYIAAWMLMRDSEGGPATFEQMLNRSFPPHAVLKLLTVGLAGATALSLVGGFGWGTLVLAIPLVLGLLTARNRGVDLRTSLLALRSDLATREPPPTGPVPQPVPAYYNPAQPWASAPQGPVDLAVVSERTSLGPDDDDEEDEYEDGDDGDEAAGGGGRKEADRHGGGCRGDGSGHGGKPRSSPLASHALWTVFAMAIAWAFTAPHLGPPVSEASPTQLLLGPDLGVYFMAAVVAVIGVYALVGAWVGNPRGLVFLGCLAVLGAMLVSSTDVTRMRIGDRDWAPATVAEAGSDDLWLNVGSGTLDLTGLSTELDPGESVDVRARVDVGSLVLVIPEDARINLVSEVWAGAVGVGDAEPDGDFVTGLGVTHEETFEPTRAPEGSGRADGAREAGNGQDGVPVINVHAENRAGTVEVRYDQAEN
ncbi:PspC domain-containing protein [Nocardiopsis sp. L17-MgMaSL7]|uniref:PspC domain-containing protein n=1 Tax=Nocardiopsis sp. L17-MgMaSL7 TaxID=1938893 RepID=UPI000D816612|nr:PspC domain-containing protein [Nocardiopsis sp. L17-MgMaSL7]PWV45120.1 phage shock protein C (PspC) family protein [Nocardiopsis sp. L17-MgMaSL7]